MFLYSPPIKLRGYTCFTLSVHLQINPQKQRVSLYEFCCYYPMNIWFTNWDENKKKNYHHYKYQTKTLQISYQDIARRGCKEVKYTVDIKNNAWVTVNNDFLSRVRRFGNDFHEWRSHEWKSLPNRLTSDKKIVIHCNECIILFLTRYFMSWTHKSAKNYHRALISPLLPKAAFSDRALWRHHNWSVTSCVREILVLWRHICLLSLHAQIGAKAIFTSE